MEGVRENNHLIISVICVGSLLSDCLGLIANTISLLFCLIHITSLVIVLPVIQLQIIPHISFHSILLFYSSIHTHTYHPSTGIQSSTDISKHLSCTAQFNWHLRLIDKRKIIKFGTKVCLNLVVQKKSFILKSIREKKKEEKIM